MPLKRAARLKPPKKTITVVNPEYAEYQKTYGKDILVDAIYAGAQLMQGGGSNPFASGEAARAEVMSYFPEDYDAKIPEEGHWVLVTKPPHTEIKISRFSIWYALPEVRPSGRAGFEYHLARLLTPHGDLFLWPHEYIKVDIAKYLQFIGEGFELQFFSESTAVQTEQLFYLMSRGVRRPDALTLLLPTLKSQTVCWLEADEPVRQLFTRD